MDERERDVLDEGERLQKIMARAGIGSRRRCEELISEGRVKVNGTVVRELGSRARAGVDTVEVDGVNIGAGERIVHYAVYKPTGYVSTASDPEGRPKVTDLVPSTLRLYPVGRLDYDTEGLIIVTNDGHLTNVLTHPSHEIGKTYLALVSGTPDDDAIGQLRHGVTLDDGVTAPARVRIIKPEGSDAWVELTIHEGRNRQVRRMCEAVGHPVLKLIRTRIGRLNLAGLQPGKFRALSAEEVAMLEEQADPQGVNAESESADWALAESRGERRADAKAAPKRADREKRDERSARGPKTKASPGAKTGLRPKSGPRAEGGPRAKGGPRAEGGPRAMGGRRPERGPRSVGSPLAGPRAARAAGPSRRETPALGTGPAPRKGPASGKGLATRKGPAPRQGSTSLPKPAKRAQRPAGAPGRGPAPANRHGPARKDSGKGVRRNGSH